MPRGPKNARYEVTDVWGCMTDKLKTGDVLVDTYRGNERSWNIARGTDMEAGGMAGRFIGRLAHIDGSDPCPKMLEEAFPDPAQRDGQES